jgi:tetratricopeptide (TPR) repeat protein
VLDQYLTASHFDLKIVRCFEQFSKLGELYSIQYKWSEAKPVFQKLVNAIENVIVSQREKKRNIIAACAKEGRLVESDENYEETVSQLKLLDTALASVLHDLGGSHERLREYEDAQRVYKRSLDISTLSGDETAASNVAAALGSLYDKAGNPADAEAMHIQAMKLNPFCGTYSASSKNTNLIADHLWIISLSERWDHPNFGTALHPFHRRPRVVTVDNVLEGMKETAKPSEEESEFVPVDEKPSPRSGLAREDIQSALDVLPETDENRRREIEAVIEEAAKLNTQIASLELDAAKSVLREAEARLPANQHYQVASAYMYAATLYKRLGQCVILRTPLATRLIFSNLRFLVPRVGYLRRGRC